MTNELALDRVSFLLAWNTYQAVASLERCPQLAENTQEIARRNYEVSQVLGISGKYLVNCALLEIRQTGE